MATYEKSITFTVGASYLDSENAIFQEASNLLRAGINFACTNKEDRQFSVSLLSVADAASVAVVRVEAS